MMIYTCSETNKDLSRLLDTAKDNDDVFIRRENGEMFIIKLFFKKGRKHNLPNIDLGLSRDEIVRCIRDVRERIS